MSNQSLSLNNPILENRLRVSLSYMCPHVPSWILKRGGMETFIYIFFNITYIFFLGGERMDIYLVTRGTTKYINLLTKSHIKGV